MLAQLCPTLCDPTDCSPPGFSVHWTPWARTLEWVCHALLQPRDPAQVSLIAGWFFKGWASRASGPLSHQGEVKSLQWRVCLQCERSRLDPWVGKVPLRRKVQPTPVFLPGESHGFRSLEGYSAWDLKELDVIEQLTLSMEKPPYLRSHTLRWVWGEYGL